MRGHRHLATRWPLTVPRARVGFFYFYSTRLHFVLVFHKSLTNSNNQVSTGTDDGVESSNGGAGRLPTIAGVTNSLVKMTTGGDFSPSSDVLPGANLQNSTDGGITTRGHAAAKQKQKQKPKKKGSSTCHAWVDQTKFTVTAGCGKCRYTSSGCNYCLSIFEHKVRVELKEMVWEEKHPGEAIPEDLSWKYKFSSLADEQGTLHEHIAEMLPAAKVRVRAKYSQADLREKDMDGEE